MPNSSYTRSTLASDIQTELNDTAGTYYTSSIVNAEINLAISDFLQMTRLRRSNAVIAVTSGIAEYSLSSLTPRVLEVLRVALPTSAGGTDERILQFATLEGIEATDSNWRLTTGLPYAYMRWNQGDQQIRLYPIPDSGFSATVQASDVTFSGYLGDIDYFVDLTDAAFTSAYGAIDTLAPEYGSLRVEYVAAGTDLSADGDSVETVGGVPPQFQDALKWYACARLCELSLPIAQRDKSPSYWAKFQQEVDKALSNQDVFQPKPVMGADFSDF